MLARSGFNVATGGGNGSMRAVAEGACAMGGHTIGMSMDLPNEKPSTDVHRECYHFDTFSDRLDKGFEERTAMTAAVPGGIGTLMELTKKATELETGKCVKPSQNQIVLFDKGGIFQEWKNFLANSLVSRGLMSRHTLDLFKVVNNIDEGVRLLQQNRQYSGGACHGSASRGFGAYA